jgi:hypothetical protein
MSVDDQAQQAAAVYTIERLTQGVSPASTRAVSGGGGDVRRHRLLRPWQDWVTGGGFI